MPEFMDIVDDGDRVIGRDTRERVHKDYQIHRGVHVIIVNSDNEVLIQRRSFKKDYYPGYYDISVGAQVSSGESYEESALRELEEEIGCTHGDIVPIAYYDAYSSRQREKRKVFLHRCDGPFRADLDEVEELEFVSQSNLRETLDSRPFTEGCKKSLLLYSHYISSAISTMLERDVAKGVLENAGLAEWDGSIPVVS